MINEVPLSALVDPCLMLAIYNEPIRTGELELYKWQTSTLMRFAEDPPKGVVRRVCVCANNGSGKSQYLISPAAVWLGMKFKRARAVITSASGTQLDRQLGKSLDHICGQVNKLHGSPLWKLNYRHYEYIPTGSTIELFATDDPGLAEGYHPHLGGEEFAFFSDEDKSIPEPIQDAIRRCNGLTRQMVVSSPGRPMGHFYDIFTDTSGRWWQRKVTYKDCPHIKQDEIEEAKARCGGETNPWFRSAYLAEFSSTDEQVVISWHNVKQAYEFPPKVVLFGSRFAGLDLSAGGDESVLSVFEGNKQIGLEAFRFDTTTKTRDHCIYLLRDKYKVSPSEVNVDDGGIGNSIIDMLYEAGFQVNRVINQARPIVKDRFANRGAELWFHFAAILGDLVLLPDDVQKDQLANRFYKLQTVTGKLLLESKQEARAKGHSSPDRADATVLAFAHKPYPYLGSFAGKARPAEDTEKKHKPTTDELIEMMDKIKYAPAHGSDGELEPAYGSADVIFSEHTNSWERSPL